MSTFPRADEIHILERKSTNPTMTRKIRTDMVRRVEDIAPRLVDPMGVPARTVTITNDAGSTYDSSNNIRRRIIASGSEHPPEDVAQPSREVGFGGFPGPREVLGQTSQKMFPQLHRRLQKTLTIPRTSTLVPRSGQSTQSQQSTLPTRAVSYLSFIANVGKNSRFQGLSDEQLLELGGVEYSALNALMWIVPLVSFVLTA